MTTEYYFDTTNLATFGCFVKKLSGNLDFLTRKTIPVNDVYYSSGASLRVDEDSIVFQDRSLNFEAYIIGDTRTQAYDYYNKFVEFLNTTKSFTITTP